MVWFGSWPVAHPRRGAKSGKITAHARSGDFQRFKNIGPEAPAYQQEFSRPGLYTGWKDLVKWSLRTTVKSPTVYRGRIFPAGMMATTSPLPATAKSFRANSNGTPMQPWVAQPCRTLLP